MDEPALPAPENWPSPFNLTSPILPILKTILESFIP
jgi:hypothetical protein